MRSLSILALSLVLFIAESVWAGCTGTPPADAVKKAQDYYKANQALIEHTSRTMGEPGRKIVINDYSKKPTQMYILSSNGDCEEQSVVGFGAGQKGDADRGELKGSCVNESYRSPSGFHITAVAGADSKYPYPQGITMLPCEGQEETGPRGIMIHARTPNGMTGDSQGCATLPPETAADWIPNKIKGGSLVYNYWGEGEDSKLKGCEKVGQSQTCQLPAGAGGSNSGSGGTGSGAGGSGNKGVTR